MLTIGEFANTTGISVKALRHYDETKALVPFEVDAATGYRRYSESQVRDGALLQTLRAAGVPLPAAAGALRDGDAADVLRRHRSEVLQKRDAEDAAMTAADAVLTAFARPAAVEERHLGATPFVARVMQLTADLDAAGVDGAGREGVAPTDEDANRAFADLYQHCVEAGLEPGPAFWTSLREAPGSPARAPELQMLLCWPVARLPKPDDASWADERILADELPPRTDLVAVWRSDGADLPEGSVHPAVVALFDALAERGVALQSQEVRQRVLGEDESDFAVEVAVTLL
ncbi:MULTISPECIES: MerR family DNA-binding transcriptional regulator [unclassified Pseudoclavibacter]|uniref:MerR family DNA-binding transcriptional regulator n=1 Tax=unclassified Pseudoclavibacter TaxID=2615177 RepID=UPI001BA94E02|nr:MerR family transcriptional regulator [Pseudoclavibacter sp. Marseille-Q4354]MBS3179262.1 MerR family DNA-binding transcriptional regulator [Pseudoclavibacter sp. Marseille-Q4354]